MCDVINFRVHRRNWHECYDGAALLCNGHCHCDDEKLKSRDFRKLEIASQHGGHNHIKSLFP